MASSVVDVNKDTIMQMLRTDVFGFKAADMEEQAKEVYHLVNGQEGVRNVKLVGGYVRTQAGFIILNQQLPAVDSATGKKKKK
jgi:hypothetical protein